MTERENILCRIREALTLPANHPGKRRGESLSVVSEERAAKRIAEVLPKVGSGQVDLLAQFAKNSADLKTDFRLVNSAEEIIGQLFELASVWKKIATHHGELTDTVCNKLSLPVCLTDEGYEKFELETCDVGITECDCLVAQTGSVLVTSRSAGGRALSVLPPHHVVLARQDQLVPDLPAAFELLENRYASNYPSFVSLITGPSRTGDIERILVLGAHGPKRLTILCY